MATSENKMIDYRSPDYQRKVSARNEELLKKRDSDIEYQRQQAELEGRASRINNASPQGGVYRDDHWTPDNWQSMADQQAIEDRNARRQANADYLRSIGDFGQNASNAISAQRDKQYGAVLAAANFALKNGGFTPPTMIDVLGNDLNSPSGNFAGSAFRGKGKDAKFTVFLRDQDGRVRPGMQLSMADLFKMDNQRGGGSFDDEAYAIGQAQMSKYMTPQQIADATSVNQLESLRDRVTGGAGGREVGGTTDGKATSRLFGRTGPTHSRISFFGTGGAGTGWTRSVYDGYTREYGEASSSERTNPNDPSNWRILESGSDGRKRYANRVTGDEMIVEKGESLTEKIGQLNLKSDPKYAAELAKASSREGIANANNASREEIAGLREAGRDGRAEMRSRSQEVKQRQDSLIKMAKLYEDRAKGEFDEKKKKEYLDQANALLDAAKSFGSFGDYFISQSGGVDEPTLTAESALDAVEKGGAKGGAERSQTTQQNDDAKRKELEAIRARKAKLQGSQAGKAAYSSVPKPNNDDSSTKSEMRKPAGKPEAASKSNGMSIPVDELTLDEQEESKIESSRQQEEKTRMKKEIARARAEKTLSVGVVETASSEDDAYRIARRLGRDKVNSLSDDEIERVFRGGFSKLAAGDASVIKAMLNIVFDQDDRNARIGRSIKKVGSKIFGGSGRPRMK